MTVHKMKAVIRDHMDANNATYSKLTAKTVGFSDMARGDMVFVKVHGWTPNPIAEDLEKLAKAEGFRVEFCK